MHDLSVEQGKVSAPRVLRTLEGDFVAEVTVTGKVQPAGGRASSYALPYHGAGLLVWLDRDNYIRLERAAILRGNEAYYYVNFEQRTSANMASSTGTATPGGPLSLRLERHGSTVSAAYKPEGQDWARIARPLSIRRWGDTLKVGVAAVTTATDPLIVQFQELRIEPTAR